MVSAFQKVFPDFNWDPPTSKSSAASNIRFLIFNLLTGGIYGSYITADLDRKSQNLKTHQFLLMSKHGELNRSIRDISQDVQKLSDKLKTGTLSDHEIAHIKSKIGQLSHYVYPNN